MGPEVHSAKEKEKTYLDLNEIVLSKFGSKFWKIFHPLDSVWWPYGCANLKARTIFGMAVLPFLCRVLFYQNYHSIEM